MTEKLYSRLTIEEREILLKGLAEGRTQKSIAKELNRNPSTISREIRRCKMNCLTYRPSIGNKDAKKKSVNRKRKYKIFTNSELTNFIEEKLEIKWSPEQISAILKREFENQLHMNISHETIYRYIYSIDDKEHRHKLIDCLRQSRKRRKPQKKGGAKRTTIRNLVSIHDRPYTAVDRKEPGHWEGDLVIGKDHKSAIGTLVERTTRFVIIVSFIGTPNAITTAHAFAAALGALPGHMKKSLTYDRGTEMAAHQRFTEITGIPVFFADPYSPWQRGTNENTNGLIRDYLPKGTDFRDINDESLIYVESALNDRPRKTLDYNSPSQIFSWLSRSTEASVDGFFEHCYLFAL